MQCSSCGTTLQPGVTSCPSCGAPVSTDTSDSSPYEEHAGAVPYIPYTPLKEREASPASPAAPAAPTAQEGSRNSDLLAGAQPQQAATPAGSGPLAQALAAPQPFAAHLSAANHRRRWWPDLLRDRPLSCRTARSGHCRSAECFGTAATGKCAGHGEHRSAYPTEALRSSNQRETSNQRSA